MPWAAYFFVFLDFQVTYIKTAVRIILNNLNGDKGITVMAFSLPGIQPNTAHGLPIHYNSKLIFCKVGIAELYNVRTKIKRQNVNLFYINFNYFTFTVSYCGYFTHAVIVKMIGVFEGCVWGYQTSTNF